MKEPTAASEDGIGDLVLCPVCRGHGEGEGDGSGWDGTSMHTPACEFCRGYCEVPEPLSTEPCPMCGWAHHVRIGECGNCGETAESVETARADYERERRGYWP